MSPNQQSASSFIAYCDYISHAPRYAQNVNPYPCVRIVTLVERVRRKTLQIMYSRCRKQHKYRHCPAYLPARTNRRNSSRRSGACAYKSQRLCVIESLSDDALSGRSLDQNRRRESKHRPPVRTRDCVSSLTFGVQSSRHESIRRCSAAPPVRHLRCARVLRVESLHLHVGNPLFCQTEERQKQKKKT